MITKFNYQGFEVAFQNGRQLMVNASEMAKPFCTKPSDWTRTEQAQRMIHALATSHNCELNDLVCVVNGGTNPGTWMHEDVALIFAQWLNPQFYIWCNSKVKEMVKIEMSLKLPDFNNPVLAARAWADAMEQKQLSQAKVLELQPKAEVYDKISDATNLLTMNDAAKTLKYGRNTLMKLLRDMLILRANNTPYQSYIDSGYFEVKIKPITNESNYCQTFVTGKGLAWLSKKLTVLN